jgi:protease II
MHTVDLNNTMMNQSIIEYNDKKQPVKITYQDYYYLSRTNQEPFYLVPRSISSISLFTYDNQGRLVSSKITNEDTPSTQIINTTFEYSTDKVIATLRVEGESQDSYRLITYDYKEGNLVKKTMQQVNLPSPYSTVDEYQYTQESNKNKELNRINALREGTPIVSKNLVKYIKSVFSYTLEPSIQNITYQFNKHGYVSSINGNLTYTYECK